MSEGAAPVLDRDTVLEPLQRAEGRLASIGRLQMAHVLEPLIERLHGGLPGADVQPVAQEALAFCRRLYANARSGEALPLARAVLAQAQKAADTELEFSAAKACGLLAADTADVVTAVEHHVHALRLAAGNAIEMSGVWNNIGMAMGIAGNYEMASRCYQRAVDLIAGHEDPVYARYAACTNLAESLFQSAAYTDGLRFAHRALHEQTEAFRDRDLHAAVLLQRNLVRLLVALGRVGEAEPHVLQIAALADQVQTPRALIAAATTRSVYELARGHSDIALTRLEKALAQARGVPAALRDTLACVIGAEEAAGNSERALIRMRELSDHVYRTAIERAREHVELASIPAHAVTALDHEEEQARARLISKLAPPAQPEGWDALQRLSVSAVMRIDKTGFHGRRVGALSKALALASGLEPLHAVEIGLAAEVHDIGMLSVPEELLAKKEAPSDGERALIRRHVDAGAEILRDDRHPRIFLAREIARYHHAHWDGAGYPEAIAGKSIPVAARICAVADAYDAMICGVGHRRRSTMEKALGELRRAAGSQLDPELVDTFEHLIRTESQDLGMDLTSRPGMAGFQELVDALQEDRGFV